MNLRIYRDKRGFHMYTNLDELYISYTVDRNQNQNTLESSFSKCQGIRGSRSMFCSITIKNYQE